MHRAGLTLLAAIALATPPSRADAAESSTFFAAFRSVCLESEFDRTVMEDKARAIGFVPAGAGAQSQGVDEGQILVLGPETAPERVLLLGRGQDYGERGVYPDATLCAMTTFTADAPALSSARTWVMPALPVQSADGFSYYVLNATREPLPAEIVSGTAAFDDAMAAGRLMFLIVGGDETMTSLSVSHPRKVAP